MISVNRKDTNEEYGCIEHFKKMKPQLCFFLEKPSLALCVTCIFSTVFVCCV